MRAFSFPPIPSSGFFEFTEFERISPAERTNTVAKPELEINHGSLVKVFQTLSSAQSAGLF